MKVKVFFNKNTTYITNVDWLTRFFIYYFFLEQQVDLVLPGSEKVKLLQENVAQNTNNDNQTSVPMDFEEQGYC